MTSIPKLPLPIPGLPWLKLVQPILILLLCAAVAWQTNQLKHRSEQLANEKTQRHEVSQLVHAEDNWESIRVHIRNDEITSENRRIALEKIDAETKQAKARADQLDQELRRVQAENQKKFAAAQATITALQNRKATGDVVKDNHAIDEDSKAAWNGWKEDGLNDDHRYDTLNPTWYRPNIQVKFVTYKSMEDLKEAFIAYYHMNPSDAAFYRNFYVLYAWTGIDDIQNNVCTINVIDPKLRWGPQARGSIGHELAHCIYGEWHGDK